MTSGTSRLTARQYAMLGEDPPGARLELVEGEIVVSPSPTPRHAHAAGMLYRLLSTMVEEQARGQILMDVDTPLGDYDVRRPDIVFYSTERLHLVTAERLAGVPNLAVEIVSPSSGRTDRADKFAQYAGAGIAHYWLIDPRAKSFQAYRLKGAHYLPTTTGHGADVVRAAPFEQFELPLSRLWL